MEDLEIKIQSIKYISELKFLLCYYKSQGKVSRPLSKMYEFTDYLSNMSDDISIILNEIVQSDRKYKSIDRKNNEIEEDLEIIYDIFSKYCYNSKEEASNQVLKDEELNKDEMILRQKILKVERKLNVQYIFYIYFIVPHPFNLRHILRHIRHLRKNEKEYLLIRVRSYIDDVLLFINSKHYEFKKLAKNSIILCKKIIKHLKLTDNPDIQIQVKELSEGISRLECLSTEKNFLNLNNKINKSANNLVEYWVAEINKDNFIDYINKIDDTIFKKACHEIGRNSKNEGCVSLIKYKKQGVNKLAVSFSGFWDNCEYDQYKNSDAIKYDQKLRELIFDNVDNVNKQNKIIDCIAVVNDKVLYCGKNKNNLKLAKVLSKLKECSYDKKEKFKEVKKNFSCCERKSLTLLKRKKEVAELYVKFRPCGNCVPILAQYKKLKIEFPSPWFE